MKNDIKDQKVKEILTLLKGLTITDAKNILHETSSIINTTCIVP